MIRGHVAVVSSDLPLSQVPPLTPNSCRKATIRLTVNNYQCFISIDGTDYCFKVMGNVRTVDKCDIANGLVRIGFSRPNLDIVISSNPGDLEVFLYIVEVVKDLIIVLPPQCSDTTHEEKLKCLCQCAKFSEYVDYHTDDWDCPLSVLEEKLCAFCCYQVLYGYNDGDDDEDPCKILKTWKLRILTFQTRDLQLGVHSITVSKYPHLTTIDARANNLVEIPEALGSLPCLTQLNLERNRLGQATNWNWLTSPFIRENLLWLCLDCNGLSKIPEEICRLKNLEVLSLDGNQLIELPAALRNLKHLSSLDVENNNLGVLPAWIYRKEYFYFLGVDEKDVALISNNYNKPRLNLNDFKTATVPSLFATTAKYIITKRLAFWEYDIPATLTDYLESAYYCRCGSIVLPDTIGHVVQCWLKTEALVKSYCLNYPVLITICCCSYECYKLIEPYMR